MINISYHTNEFIKFKNKVELYPSVFSFKSLDIGNEIRNFDKITSAIHLDLIDGQYINNFGVPFYICKQISNYSAKPLHIHTMMFIDKFIDQIIGIKPDMIFIHPQTATAQSLQKLISNNIKIGIAVCSFTELQQHIITCNDHNPNSHTLHKNTIQHHKKYQLNLNSFALNSDSENHNMHQTQPNIQQNICINRILFMTVNPGKPGQQFIESKVDDIHQIKTIFPYTHLIIDGGVNIQTLNTLQNTIDGAVVGFCLTSAKS